MLDERVVVDDNLVLVRSRLAPAGSSLKQTDSKTVPVDNSLELTDNMKLVRSMSELARKKLLAHRMYTTQEQALDPDERELAGLELESHQ